MGQEPVTTYTYVDGVLVSSQPEPEFDDTERDWMLSLAHYREHVLCPRCGMPKEICRAKATEGKVDVEFERCHITTALLIMQEKNEKAKFLHSSALMYSAGVKPV